MKFVFVGASGFAGKHALDVAREAGCAALGTQSRPGNPHLLTFNLLEHRIADCLDKEFLEGGEEIFGVVCASVRQIDRCFREAESSYRINVENTILAIDDLAALGVRPVFLSSSYVFDGRKGYYTEQDPRCPLCEYGRHKAEVEDYLIRRRPEALILRLEKLVGDDPAEDHLFSQWLAWVRQGQPIVCIADQVMAPTHVRDIGRAVVAACERRLTGCYHAANTEFFSREELARQFVEFLQADVDIQVKPQSEFAFDDARPLKTYLDSSQFVRATGMWFTSMRETMSSFAARARRER